ncbi:MAG: hypothetical protein AAFO91_09510 [Bacteroidota bacterium]
MKRKDQMSKQEHADFNRRKRARLNHEISSTIEEWKNLGFSFPEIRNQVMQTLRGMFTDEDLRTKRTGVMTGNTSDMLKYNWLAASCTNILEDVHSRMLKARDGSPSFRVSKDTGCWIAKGKAARPLATFSNEQLSIMQDDGRVFSKAVGKHIISALLAGKVPLDDGDECSHLCHNTKCFHPDHVLFESPTANARRNKCKKHFMESGIRHCICEQSVSCFP